MLQDMMNGEEREMLMKSLELSYRVLSVLRDNIRLKERRNDLVDVE